MKTRLIVGVVVVIGVMASIAREVAGAGTIASPAPAAERDGDQYLTARIALADLVIGERILAAEDLANEYAHERPGFAAVLRTDGFRQDAAVTWVYDRDSSWMRFPLNR